MQHQLNRIILCHSLSLSPPLPLSLQPSVWAQHFVISIFIVNIYMFSKVSKVFYILATFLLFTQMLIAFWRWPDVVENSSIIYDS